MSSLSPVCQSVRAVALAAMILPAASSTSTAHAALSAARTEGLEPEMAGPSLKLILIKPALGALGEKIDEGRMVVEAGDLLKRFAAGA